MSKEEMFGATASSDNKRTYVNYYNPNHPDTNVEPGSDEAGYFEALEWAKEFTNRKVLVGELVRGVMLAKRGERNDESDNFEKNTEDFMKTAAFVVTGDQDLQALADAVQEVADAQAEDDEE